MVLEQQKKSNVLIALCFGIFAILVVFIAVTSGSSLPLVFVGLFPSFIYLISVFGYFLKKKEIFYWLAFLPFIFSILFYLLWSLHISATLSQMEGPILTMFNMFLMYIFSFIIIFSFPVEKEKTKKVMKKMKKHLKNIRIERKKIEKAKKVTPKNLTSSMRHIEDKCKAINFVIGRVYSNKHGGSVSVREKMSVPRELYNKFTKLRKENAKPALLFDVIQQIYKKLLDLEKAEFDLFRLSKAEIPIERDFFGHDRVIDVLIKNDKDPIEDYYKEAKVTCFQLMDFFKQKEIERKKMF